MSRVIGLHIFCSVKGGVGKSTLAVACAHLLAEAASPCVVIDADLTGTSLADGLRMQAPILLSHADGTLNLDEAPPNVQFYDAEQTRRRRLQRVSQQDNRPVGIPFFNDLLLNIKEDPTHVGRVDAALWRAAATARPGWKGEVLYLPSSPTRRDVAHSLGWLYHPENPLLWLRRVSWIIDELLSRMPELQNIVIDLPPGLAGFSHEVLLLAGNLSPRRPMPAGYPEWDEVEWRINPFLVMSQDSNDLFAALEYYQEFRSFVPELRPVVNRRSEGIESIRKRVQERFRGEMVYDGIEQNLEPVDNLGLSLGRLFIDGTLHYNDEVLRLQEVLRLAPHGS